MRASWLLSCALLLAGAACSKKAATDGESSGPSSPGGSPAAAGAGLELGKDSKVTAGKTYRVGDVSVTVVTIGMANGMNAQGREDHWIHMSLRVAAPGGQTSELELAGDDPEEAAGLVFRADALGYQWGATPATATLRVDRK